jgi:hypothetical protein
VRAARIRHRVVVLIPSGALLDHGLFPDALPHGLAREQDVMELLTVMRHLKWEG